MNKIDIIDRSLSTAEQKQMDDGFDQLALEEGGAFESSEKISFVAMDGDDFIGGAVGLAYKNGDNYSGWFFISDLFVEKDRRSQGLGALLLNALEKKIQGIGLKHACLWTSGEKSIKFYMRHGYHQFAELENWYSDGSNRVGLRKDF